MTLVNDFDVDGDSDDELSSRFSNILASRRKAAHSSPPEPNHAAKSSPQSDSQPHSDISFHSATLPAFHAATFAVCAASICKAHFESATLIAPRKQFSRTKATKRYVAPVSLSLAKESIGRQQNVLYYVLKTAA